MQRVARNTLELAVGQKLGRPNLGSRREPASEFLVYSGGGDLVRWRHRSMCANNRRYSTDT